MASAALRPSSNGASSRDRSDDRMLDHGGEPRELSIPSSPRSSVDYKSPDGSWDAMSGSFDSPRSSVSTSSIESPFASSSNLTRTPSGKLKARRNQSAFYDEQAGAWKCRNCGGTYDVPNPGSRQRREHKKACKETQRLQAIKRAREEQARRDEASLRDQGLLEGRKHQEIPRGSSTDHLLQNGHSAGSVLRDTPSIMGAFDTTPDIPEREEVNYEAPKELIHNIELDPAGLLREPQTADSQGSTINGQKRRYGQDGAELDRTEFTMETFGESDLPSKQDPPAGKASSPAKIEVSGESEDGSSTPSSDEAQLTGTHEHHWIDEASPSPKTQISEEFERVEYCSPAVSNGVHLEETLYDRLVDLHDDPQVVVTRSASVGPGGHEHTRTASLNHKSINTAMGVNFTRAVSLDHCGVGVTPTNDANNRTPKMDRGTEAAMPEEHSRDSSPDPDDLIEALIGRNHSRSPTLNHGVEMKQDHSNALDNGHFPTAFPSVVSKKTQADSPRVVGDSREQSGTSSKQSQTKAQGPRGSGASSRNQSDHNPRQDDSFGAVIARNVGRFWMHAASVGAVALIAWVGKSLGDRQQRPRRQAPRCRRGDCALIRYYWDE